MKLFLKKPMCIHDSGVVSVALDDHEYFVYNDLKISEDTYDSIPSYFNESYFA